MATAPLDFVLIIPAYCEQDRLPAFLRELIATLSDAPFLTMIQIVDDGSPAESQRQLLQALESPPASISSVTVASILFLPIHVGKGQAIRVGWSNAPEAPWLAFVDADGAISAAEVRRVLMEIWTTPQANNIDCFIATRNIARSQRRWLRGLTSRFFTEWIQSLFQIGFHDTQCGFKAIRQPVWHTIQSQCLEQGFCFDLELIARLQENNSVIREIAIDWQEKKNGHFRLLIDGPTVILQTLRLRHRLKEGIT